MPCSCPRLVSDPFQELEAVAHFHTLDDIIFYMCLFFWEKNIVFYLDSFTCLPQFFGTDKMYRFGAIRGVSLCL